MGRFLIEIWLLGTFLRFWSIFGRVLAVGLGFRYRVDFWLLGRFFVEFWLLGRVLAIGSIFDRDLAFELIFIFWVDF